MEGSVNVKSYNSTMWACIRLNAYIDDVLFPFDSTNTSANETQIPDVSSIYLETGAGVCYDLQRYGHEFVKFLNGPDYIQSRYTCYQFTDIFLRDHLQQPRKHINQRWCINPEPVGNYETLKPFTGLTMTRDGKPIHSAFFIADGLCLWKIGIHPWYTVTSLDTIRNVYNFDEVHINVLDSICEGCLTRKPPDDLSRCSNCKISTYCTKQCQRSAWKEHQLVCEVLRDPQTFIAKDMENKCYSFIGPHVEGILKELKHDSEEVVNWVKTLLSCCNTEFIPCTKLEELNELLQGQSALYDLHVPFQDSSSIFHWYVAKLTKRAKDLVLYLSHAKAICFVAQNPKEWQGKTKHIVTEWNIEQNFTQIVQAPFVIRCLPASCVYGFFQQNTLSKKWQFVWKQ